MKKIRFSLVFNRVKRLNKDGEGLIQIKAYQNPTNRYFSTEKYVLPNQWDKKRNEIKNHPNAHILNKQMREQIDAFKAFEIDRTNLTGFCSLDDLGDFAQRKGLPSFLEFCDTELKNSPLAKLSKLAHRNTLNKLKIFRASINFHDLTYQLVSDFDTHLRKTGLSDVSIEKHHKQVKKYINIAIKKSYIDDRKNPYKAFKVRRGESEKRTFLSLQEIEKLENITFPESEFFLERIRDMFLFSCFTGLRFSDLIKVSKRDITETQKGLYLEGISQKTKKAIELPLYNLFKIKGNESRPEQIVRKYLKLHKEKYNDNSHYEKEPFFKGLTNQYFNRELKTLAKKACIGKEITTHIGRHTFGTIMATKVKPTVLKTMMQHSSINTTMIYIHLSKSLLDEELDKINW